MSSIIKQATNHHKIGYVFNPELLSLINQLPVVKNRALMAHKLMAAYGLLKQCILIPVTPASDQQLRSFHHQYYIEFVKELSALQPDDPDQYDQDLVERCETFGLSYDCPAIPRLYKTISYLAASSIAAAKSIVTQQCQIALNWFGGWHHGMKDEAAGFCYTNDIVFSILTFLENNFQKVLYVDFDLHHGNGVEDAFVHTDKVITLSLHKHEFGFYPGTGDISDIGLGNKGKYHSINMPLAEGINDHQYCSIFEKIITKLIPKFGPQVIVCQCGADVLSGDRMKSFNLTLKTFEHCIPLLLSYDIPMLFLGGGGYNCANTSRLWTLITALCLNRQLDVNIPEHDFFLNYGPTYELPIIASAIPNQNEEETIAKHLAVISDNMQHIHH